jgi:hypothetical protein
MFDMESWFGRQRVATARYAALRHQIDDMEAQAAALLADRIDAYRWPEDLPVEERPENYRAEILDGKAYGEDLTSELAVANHTSYKSAEFQVDNVATLVADMPGCWAAVTHAVAPLWQASLVAQSCLCLDAEQRGIVDRKIAACLGAVGLQRLRRRIASAIAAADPKGLRLKAKDPHRRYVRTGGEPDDALTGYVMALCDRRDQQNLEATLSLLAGELAVNGDARTLDERRASALGLLANPYAALQLIEDGSTPGPEATACKGTVYVHAYVDSLQDADALARVEAIGPVLMDQISDLTRAAKLRVTPVVHVGAGSVAVDSYEIPDAIREQVLATYTYDIFPWSSAESRHLDLDHTLP